MKDFKNHLIKSSASIREGLVAINQLSDATLNLLVIADNGQLIGSLTDGDIRRALIRGVELSDSIKMAMNTDFKFIRFDQIDNAKIKAIREQGIKLLPILYKNGCIAKVYDLVSKCSILPIDAVLMAGGKGERLRPLTNDVPKPLLKLEGKPIIDYNIDRLVKFGVENIYVTVNYLAKQIENYFTDEREGAKINCVREPKYLGTIGSVKFVDHFHNDTILVMNSDIFANIDLEEFYDHFVNHNADMSVVAVPYSVSVPYGILELENRKIKGLLEKPTYNYFANGGVYLIKRKLLELIPDDVFFDATDFIELLVGKNLNVVRFPHVGYWIDIGKPEDYKKAQEFAKHIK
jgi:dTDP-glucose pyrophosphorylase